jgi:hypothetical protein
VKPDLSLQGADEPKEQIVTVCDLFDHAPGLDKVALRHLDVALTYHEFGRAVAASRRGRHRRPCHLRELRNRSRAVPLGDGCNAARLWG